MAFYRDKLTKTAAAVDAGYPANTDLVLDGDKPVLKRRKGNERRPSALALEAAIHERLPERSLLDLLGLYLRRLVIQTRPCIDSLAVMAWNWSTARWGTAAPLCYSMGSRPPRCNGSTTVPRPPSPSTATASSLRICAATVTARDRTIRCPTRPMSWPTTGSHRSIGSDSRLRPRWLLVGWTDRAADAGPRCPASSRDRGGSRTRRDQPYDQPQWPVPPRVNHPHQSEHHRAQVTGRGTGAVDHPVRRRLAGTLSYPGHARRDTPRRVVPGRRPSRSW